MSIPMMKKFLDKLEVENLVKKKDQSLFFAKPPGAKSSYWDKFQEILVNNVRQRFIICNDCHSILTWSASDGTNVMKKHLIGCSKTKEPSPQTTQAKNKRMSRDDQAISSDHYEQMQLGTDEDDEGCSDDNEDDIF